MDPIAFTAWLQAINAADSALAGLITLGKSVRDTLSQDNQAQLDAKLGSLQVQNDAAYLKVDAELDADAQKN